MVRSIIPLLLALSLSASPYEQSCTPCHKNLQSGLDKLFYLYLQTYSSERRIKQALIDYLQAPEQEKSVMNSDYFKAHRIKQATTLNEEQLQKAIDTYWERFKIFGKLK